MSRRASICLVQPFKDGISETFIRAQAEYLPAKVTVIHGTDAPGIDDRPLLQTTLFRRGYRYLRRQVLRESLEDQRTAAYCRAFRRYRPNAVIAQYGPMGVVVMEACRRAGLPLIVHFRGYDASRYSVLEKYRERYQALFSYAHALVAVSQSIQSRLLGLGAPPGKVHWNPSGANCERFTPGDPSTAAAVFLAVGRFVEKKGPHLTLLAFAEALKSYPEMRLHMIGDGPLLGACQQLTKALGVNDVVRFLGAQPHQQVASEMQRARCFVQHSITATDGDSEGTPVAVMEAGAAGLPVISTKHAGIPEVVIDSHTGFLVDEGDIHGMATRMIELARTPSLARTLGCAAHVRIKQEFSVTRSVERLWQIVKASFDTHCSAQ